MKYRMLFLVALSTLFVACKKNDAVSKVDPNLEDIEVPLLLPTEDVVMEELLEAGVNQRVTADGKYPVLTFDRKEHDFGTVNEGEKVETTFHFVNTGDADLIITNAVGTCGCTVPEFPKEPIKPGGKGKLKVSFDSTGKPGMQQKSVNITCNTVQGKDVLTLKTNVIAKAGTQSVQSNGMTITTTPN